MAIKPILFNTEMVLAILDGRKTCTRRIIKAEKVDNVLNSPARKSNPDIPDAQFIKCLLDMKYEPGDILYVRETWSEWTDGYVYKAWNSPFPQAGKSSVMKWHPSIHMPKEAARIWLRVTDVRVERLQDITIDEIRKEGLESRFDVKDKFSDGIARGRFLELWDSTIKKPDIDRYGWDANPWVWVVEFERCEKPENL